MRIKIKLELKKEMRILFSEECLAVLWKESLKKIFVCSYAWQTCDHNHKKAAKARQK